MALGKFEAGICAGRKDEASRSVGGLGVRLDAVKWEAEAKAEKQKSGKAESREVA